MFGNRFKNVKKEVYIEVNPFLHSPINAFKLIADIANHVENNTQKENFFKKIESILNNDSFRDEVINKLGYKAWLTISKEYENSKEAILSVAQDKSIKIVLAGQFSAGKSSFLNSLFCKNGETAFLPVDVKPTSVVPTYLYCSTEFKEQRFIAENFNHAKMCLSKMALLAMGHEFEAKYGISIMVFLKKIIIQQPVEKSWLNNLVFIDTPGYSNEDGINNGQSSNRTSDKDTASQELQTADVLIWLIDSGTPTLKIDDLNFIKHFDKSKPILFVLNKADKLTKEECKKAIDGIYLQVKNYQNLVDIIAFSSLDNEFKGSLYNINSWEELFKKIKRNTTENVTSDEFKKIIDESYNLFYQSFLQEKEHKEQTIKDNNERIMELSNSKFHQYDSVKEEIALHYHQAQYYHNIYEVICDLCENGFDRELKWADKSGFFSDTSFLYGLRFEDRKFFYSIVQNVKGLRGINDEVIKFLEESNQESYVKSVTMPQKELASHNDDLRMELKEMISSNSNFFQLMNSISLEWDIAIKEVFKIDRTMSNFDQLPLVGQLPQVNCPFECIKNDDFEKFVTFFAVKKDVKYLMEDNTSLLQKAVKYRRYKFVTFLLEANPSCTSLIHHAESNQTTAFDLATQNEDKILIDLFDQKLNHLN